MATDGDGGQPVKNEPDLSAVNNKPNLFVDFLLFKLMVGPWFLIGLYWLLVVIFIGAGLVMMFMGLVGVSQNGDIFRLVAGVLLGLAFIFLGPIFSRIVFEVMMIQFRIYDTLCEIRNKL